MTESTTKREIILENTPDDHWIKPEELAQKIGKREGVHYDHNTIKKTLEYLRKEGKVKDNGNKRGTAYKRPKAKLRQAPPVVRLVSDQAPPKISENNTTTQEGAAAMIRKMIDDATSKLIEVAGELEAIKGKVDEMDNNKELEELRLFKADFDRLMDRR